MSNEQQGPTPYVSFWWLPYLLLAMVLYLASIGPVFYLTSHHVPRGSVIHRPLRYWTWPVTMMSYTTGLDREYRDYVRWWEDVGK